MHTSDLLYRQRLGFPWVTSLLAAACVLVSAPLYVDPHRYFLTLGVGFCEADGAVQWWHAIVSRFVHGNGVDCGFPSTTTHLFVNVSLFVFHGMLAERLLGSGRVALLTFCCLVVQIVLAHVFVGGRVHGASGMTWSYVPFVCHWLVWSWRRERWRLLVDPAGVCVVLWTLFSIAGLVKHWHLWNLLLSIPFYLAWRKTLGANLEAASRGAALDRGRPAWNVAGIGVAAALVAFNAVFVGAAAARVLEPLSVECSDFEAGGLPCVIDATGRATPVEVRFEVALECANGASGSAQLAQRVEPGQKATVVVERSRFGDCDRITRGSLRSLSAR